VSGGPTVLATAAEIVAATSAATAVWLFAAWMEQRRGEPGRGRRLALVAVALAAVVALQVRPAAPRLPAELAAVLATPGATAAEVAAAVAAGERVWALPGRPGEPAPPPGAPLLTDAAALGRSVPGVRSVRVLGHGLTAAEWQALPLPAHAGTPPPLPAGIARIAWDRRLPLGDAVTVRGEVAGVPAAGGTLSLAGAGIAGATVALPPGRSAFALSGVPRAAGRHLLDLRLRSPGAPPVAETIDLEVAAPAPPAVLWLEDAPSLESRELARWLGAAGGRLAVRARLSRGVAREQLVGLPAPLPLAPLTAALLARFDLAVVDGGTLAALSAGDSEALRRAVVEGGLGLLVRPEAGAVGTTRVLGQQLDTRAVPGSAELLARLAWPGGEQTPPLAVPARELVPAGGLVPLAADRSGRLLAAWLPAGAGAVGVTLVEGTWRWVREGSAAAHRRYWREVLASLARPAPPGPRWSLPAGPAIAGRPAAVQLATDAPAPAAAVRGPDGDVARPGLRQEPAATDRWATTWWPRASGWHQVGEGEGSLAVWVAPADRWRTLRLAERQEATAMHLVAPPPGTPRREPDVLQPLPRWPWFALLLASLGLLWAEEAWRRVAVRAPVAR
jgi:hypothetical protein